MYIGPRRRRRRSSPALAIVLLALIGAATYVLVMVREKRIESPFVPTATPTRTALSYADEAQEWYLQGKLHEAIAAYERAIELDPNDVLLYIPLARLLTLEGRMVEAVRTAEQARDMAPDNARAWAVLGMAYDWNGDYSEAIDACKRAIQLDPTYAEAYAYLAEAYADVVRWVEAMDNAETALQLDSHSVDVQRNYGYVLENQGNYKEAVEAYERALTLHPNLAYVQVAAGRNYAALGDFDAAARSYQRAIEIDPDDVEPYYRLGRAYYDEGDYERAESYLKQAIEADPEFSAAYGYLAFSYWRRRNPRSAMENLELAIELSFIASRREADLFYITIEDLGAETTGPSPGAAMRGEFTPTSPDNLDTLRALLKPQESNDEEWASARGTVTLEARTGKYTVRLSGLPKLKRGQAYVGWFEGVNTLSGDPISTGPLEVDSDGRVEVELETGWVEGPRIEYFYTLGLAYYYDDQCDKSYPLFDAALQINPEEYSALEGIRLCQEDETKGAGE